MVFEGGMEGWRDGYTTMTFGESLFPACFLFLPACLSCGLRFTGGEGLVGEGGGIGFLWCCVFEKRLI